jgi:hypothetical protein
VATIGDTEPEDAYDASDRLEERLTVLVRILEARDADTDVPRRDRRTLEALRLLFNLGSELEGWRAQLDELIERAQEG